jgi:hypothetical protein
MQDQLDSADAIAARPLRQEQFARLHLNELRLAREPVRLHEAPAFSPLSERCRLTGLTENSKVADGTGGRLGRVTSLNFAVTRMVAHPGSEREGWGADRIKGPWAAKHIQVAVGKRAAPQAVHSTSSAH